jgi:hypothetical protein
MPIELMRVSSAWNAYVSTSRAPDYLVKMTPVPDRLAHPPAWVS